MMRVEEFKKNDMENLSDKYKGKIVSILKKDEELKVHDEDVGFNCSFVFITKVQDKFVICKNKDISFLPIVPGRSINKKELLEFIIKCKKEKYLIVGEENII